MKNFFVRLALLLLMFGASPVFAQTTMTDEQVLEYIKQGMQQGKDQKQLAIELARRGVTQEQAKRVQETYQQQVNNENGLNSSQQEASRLRDQNQMGKNQKNDTKNYNNNEKNNNQNLSKVKRDDRVKDMDKVTNNPYSQQYAQDMGLDKAVMILSDSIFIKTLSEYDPEDQVFGRNIFNSENLSFEPNMNLATPQNYLLGPGDEVIIDIWGASQNTVRAEISPDGFINIPDLGLVSLNGMTVADATVHLKNELRKIYADEGNNIQVSLGSSRSIIINVMGEVMHPGTYTLSAFSSVFHALYSAGGISDIGSLRNIHVSRNGKNIATVDVYEFIMNGKTQDDIRLQEGDVVIVPPYESIVKITGKVKRPMKYEMKKDESMSMLLKYAGYFSADAYKNSVRVIRQAGREYSVATVNDNEYATFKLMDGDEVTADKILKRYANKLEIRGAVYRPGIYEFDGNINTVKQLINQADGLLGDAFTNRAVLYRQRENLTSEVLSVDVKGILDGTSPDIPLRKNDVLYIPSIYDLKDMGCIYISGEVAKPGEYPYADNMTLEDIVITAGGLKESASRVRVDVSRRIKNASSTEVADTVGQNFSFALKNGFIVDGQPGFILEPFDQVFVRRSPAYSEQKNVTINGEVLYEGEYALSLKNERLSSLIRRAGGVTEFGYTKGAKLTRVANDDELKRMQDVIKMMQKEIGANMADSLMLELDSVFTVGINLEEALANPGGNADIVLREGDVISVPEFTSTVKINGAVMMPNTVTYIEGKNVGYYLNQAGGYSQNAKKTKKFIIYMNGQVAKVKSRSKAVEPGCEIVIPNKTKKNTFGNAIGYATSFASLAMMVVSIANLIK